MSFDITTLEGRTAIVTGAGQGIGEAIAEALLAAGATVVAVDREEAGIKALSARESRVIPIQGDVTDPGLTSKLDAELSKNGLTLSILVNNAGVGRGSHAIETTDEDLQRYFDINVKGAFALSRWGVPLMIRAGSGAIVNTASVFGLIGAYNSAAYSVSKGCCRGHDAPDGNGFRTLRYPRQCCRSWPYRNAPHCRTHPI